MLMFSQIELVYFAISLDRLGWGNESNFESYWNSVAISVKVRIKYFKFSFA
jgi:hypothetical protein